jgi:hypothetical protein
MLSDLGKGSICVKSYRRTQYGSFNISALDIVRTPTEYLLGDDLGQLSPMMV